MEPEIVGNLFVAVATLAAALVGGWAAWYVNNKVEERKQSADQEQQILRSLEFLTGGTQNRSAGLGILEGMLNYGKDPDRDGRLRKIFLPVIRNQIIYLATSCKPKLELHEHDNFTRLVNLWVEMNPKGDDTMPLKRALSAPRNGGLEFVGDYCRDIERLKESLNKCCDHVAQG